jgi:hypothetical protein
VPHGPLFPKFDGGRGARSLSVSGPRPLTVGFARRIAAIRQPTPSPSFASEVAELLSPADARYPANAADYAPEMEALEALARQVGAKLP